MSSASAQSREMHAGTSAAEAMTAAACSEQDGGTGTGLEDKNRGSRSLHSHAVSPPAHTSRADAMSSRMDALDSSNSA